ncbi:MAG: TonB-dependent receptor, partial [Ideonella sp.]|nr:TonB-dependent receptor [Ideonella sp.]
MPPGTVRARRLVRALAVALSPGLCGPVLAQAAAGGTDLGRVVITGNPLGNRDPAVPVSVLEGEALLLRRGSSLGATLDGLAGVSSTWFGPNANRPVVRGLDGDRVR